MQDLAETNQPAGYRERVERLEDAILALPQVDLLTEHVFSGGLYARTITIPAGTALTGAAHKTDHLNICVGDIEVLTDDGPKRLTGLHVLATKAGMKRAGYAHADTRWTTVCMTSYTSLADLAAIEAELVEEPERLQTRTQSISHADPALVED